MLFLIISPCGGLDFLELRTSRWCSSITSRSALLKVLMMSLTPLVLAWQYEL